MPITLDQLRAARAFLDMRIQDVSNELEISMTAVQKGEVGVPRFERTRQRMVELYQSKGLQFIENGVQRAA